MAYIWMLQSCALFKITSEFYGKVVLGSTNFGGLIMVKW